MMKGWKELLFFAEDKYKTHITERAATVTSVHKVSSESVKRSQEELSRLLSKLELNRSGSDWDAALKSHKHHADKQTCDFSL